VPLSNHLADLPEVVVLMAVVVVVVVVVQVCRRAQSM
jgi:hypothetical protein